MSGQKVYRSKKASSKAVLCILPIGIRKSSFGLAGIAAKAQAQKHSFFSVNVSIPLQLLRCAPFKGMVMAEEAPSELGFYRKPIATLPAAKPEVWQ